MTQNSLLDTLLSLFTYSLPSSWWPLRIMPYLLIHLVGMWLTMVGWKRHRAPGFLLLFAGASIGLLSTLLWLPFTAVTLHTPPNNFTSNLFGIVTQLNIIELIFDTAGIWHFVYRARFAPREPTPQ